MAMGLKTYFIRLFSKQKKKSCKPAETSLQDYFTYDLLLKWGCPF